MRASVGFVAKNLKHNLLFAGYVEPNGVSADCGYALLSVLDTWRAEDDVALQAAGFAGVHGMPPILFPCPDKEFPAEEWTFHEVFMESAD